MCDNSPYFIEKKKLFNNQIGFGIPMTKINQLDSNATNLFVNKINNTAESSLSGNNLT